MTYEPHDHDTVVVDEGGGYNTGVIVGAIVVLVVLALVALYMLGGMNVSTGTTHNGSGTGGNNGGGGQPLPSLSLPSAGAS